jgi:hypothetical protein
VLPDAPTKPATIPAQTTVSAPRASIAPWLFNPQLNLGKPLTLSQKFRIYSHQTLGPPAVFGPAISAGIRMARPNSNYPRDWQDGAGAFGRLYGSTVATQTSKHTAEFLTEAAFHYDARYFRSQEKGVAPRLAHALEYVFVEKTDSGKTSIALPHLVGAVTGGFIGMAYLPPGYNDATHAERRAASEFLSSATRNIAFEFAPELAPLERKLHIPKLVPVWWTGNQRARNRGAQGSATAQ